MAQTKGRPDRAAHAAAIAELADRLPVGVFLTDRDGRCTYVNQQWCALSGLTPEQALDRGWADAVHADDRAAVRRAWLRFGAGDEPLTTEFRFRLPGGRSRSVRVLGRAERDEDGGLRRCVGTVTELTDRRAGTALLAQLVERISDMIIVVDADGMIRWANDVTERTMGHDRAAKVGTPILDLVHADDQRAAARGLAHATTREPLAPLHLRVRCKDGSWRDVEVVTTNLLDEPTVRGLVLIARDLTERQRLERRIHELEHSFTAAFRHSPVGRALVDLDGRWLEVNDALSTLLGRPAAELLGTAGIDAVHPDDRERVRAELGRLGDGRTDRVTVDVRFLHPGGDTVWTRFTVWHVLDDDGTALHFAADVTDVTEVRAARDAEERAHRELRVLLERSADLIVVLDAEARMTYLSPAGERLFGRRGEDAVGLPGTALVHPDDVEAVAAKLADVLAEPGRAESVTCRVLHNDGTYRWVDAIGRNLLDDPAFPGVVINIRDITEHVATETTLRETQARFAALVEHASDLISVNDLDGVVTYASPSAVSVLGVEPTELVGHQARDLMHPDDVERVEQTAAEQFARSVAEPIQYRAQHRDGSWRDLEAIITDLIDEPSVRGIVTNARDVTERRAAERRAAELVEILEATKELVVASDPGGRITYANRSARTLLGAYTLQRVTELSSDATRERLRVEIMPTARRRGTWTGELELIDTTGGAIPVAATVQVLRDERGTVSRIATVAHDITELKAAQRRLEFEATHDALTGLPNRALFREIGERALAHAGRSAEQLAVLFLDLDGFKLVNDSFGHDIGDVLLGLVARRLRDAVRAGDTLARLGGDEFVILCEQPRGEHAMLELSERIIETVSQPSVIDGDEVRVGLSIGIAFSHGADTGIVELIRDADVALYRAKHEGRGRALLFEDARPSSSDG